MQRVMQRKPQKQHDREVSLSSVYQTTHKAPRTPRVPRVHTPLSSISITPKTVLMTQSSRRWMLAGIRVGEGFWSGTPFLTRLQRPIEKIPDQPLVCHTPPLSSAHSPGTPPFEVNYQILRPTCLLQKTRQRHTSARWNNDRFPSTT